MGGAVIFAILLSWCCDFIHCAEEVARGEGTRELPNKAINGRRVMRCVKQAS